MLAAEARLLRDLKAALRAAVRPFEAGARTDPVGAARGAAKAVRRAVAAVVYQGRQRARKASLDALRAELALAKRQGAALPAPKASSSKAADRKAAAATADSYAADWLTRALGATGASR